MMQAIASSSRAPLRTIVGSGARYASSESAAAASSSTPPDVPLSSAPARRRRRRAADDVEMAGQDLIGPPDPLSNLRPVIYASTPHRRRTPNSPYSTEEFPAHSSALGELELEWRLRQERVDLQNHRFWASMNQEFNAQLAHRLSNLPPPADPPSPEDIKRREDVYTQFYADWQASTRASMNKWVWDWWAEIWAGLRIQSKIHFLRLFKR